MSLVRAAARLGGGGLRPPAVPLGTFALAGRRGCPAPASALRAFATGAMPRESEPTPRPRVPPGLGFGDPTVAPQPANVHMTPLTRPDTRPMAGTQSQTSDPVRRNAVGIQMLSRSLHDQLFLRKKGRDILAQAPAGRPQWVGYSDGGAASAEMSTDGFRLSAENFRTIKEVLTAHRLWNPPTTEPGSTPPGDPTVDFHLPPLYGSTVAEHLQEIGQQQAAPVLDRVSLLLERPASSIPFPSTWRVAPGWSFYPFIKDGNTDTIGEGVPYTDPLPSSLVFDVEVCPADSPHPIVVAALSPGLGWFTWLSNRFLDVGQSPPELLPIGPAPGDGPRLLVGHNVGFDRARVLEEYHLTPSEDVYLDTMSLHMAVAGLTSLQRAQWKRHRNEPDPVFSSPEEAEEEALHSMLFSTHDSQTDWKGSGSANSLVDVYRFYVGGELDKSDRNYFLMDSLEALRKAVDVPALLAYTAGDVLATLAVFQAVFPRFQAKCPHPISLVGMVEMGKCYLPVTENWEEFKASAESRLVDMQKQSATGLYRLLDESLAAGPPLMMPEGPYSPEALLEGENSAEWQEAFARSAASKDPWLKRLDWTPNPLRMTKPKYKKDGSYAKGGEPRPVSRQRLPGYPSWFRELCPSSEPEPRVTTRTRITPYLLKLQWQGFPLHYVPDQGWGFIVPYDKVDSIQSNASPLPLDPDDPKSECFFPIPHKDGPDARCGNPLSKDYLSAIETGLLTSVYPVAREVLRSNSVCSYWMSARSRVFQQFVAYAEEPGLQGWAQGYPMAGRLLAPRQGEDDPRGPAMTEADRQAALADLPLGSGVPAAAEDHPASGPTAWTSATRGRDGYRLGAIIPKVVTAGTVTRRAVEPTWMTASNPRPGLLASELKATVRAPPGYVFVGADVDSQELWISALLGDASLGIHGSTAFGWMTLQGSRKAGTDLHSRTAEILGISRDHAKVFNYSRIYGAGQKHAIQLMLQFNKSLTYEEASRRAFELYRQTKGSRQPANNQPATRPGTWRKRHATTKTVWHGGTESFMFNALERIATSRNPRTPTLGCAISDALHPSTVGTNFMTSRVNWVVQSSGVDYLHMLLTCMRWLLRMHGGDLERSTRFIISIHDEVRLMTREEYAPQVSLALQISNLLTRAMFAESVGMPDLPQSVAFFSAVDVDHVLRKEVDLTCVTPSNPLPLASGYRLDIHDTLALTAGGKWPTETP
ncbi:hypothetical protein H696_04304 [Fonticula alba]|uniref:Mitochondrial DNA polymerase catalytic subunit n=1 Tax=Fonticula alba TaxID=691883 RepID=A0A058Z5U0_FONAL|nr:hypothetical protein H696_04304 [Fonticula alba]KCV68887.1 hypothetical protein H696_04304 [Fonticula alba]|eukprot:XP_009496458.1 hypothetical protein H696_04304 [Fonticula alba]